jgi:Uma2 family endonuclease
MVAVLSGMTVAEWIELERNSDEKHELCDGVVVAMAGARRRHSLVAGNLFAAIHAELRERPCEVYPSDMKVSDPRTGFGAYPDVSIVCGEPRFADDKEDVLLNPQVIFEVLSESTERYARGRKFLRYRGIEAISDYVLLSTDQALVEHYTRQPDGGWLMHELHAGEELVLRSVDCRVKVDEIYGKVFAGPES